MYKGLTIHIEAVDEVEIHREDDKVQITVSCGDDAVDIFIDPAHFGALRKAIRDAEASRGYVRRDQ